MIRIAAGACRLLAHGREFVLATIVGHRGSTPRSSGTQMLVTADGAGLGTIGGGILEAGVMARAPEVLARGLPRILPVDLTPQQAAETSMICGGRVEVLLDPVRSADGDADVFEQWRETLERGDPAWFVTKIMPEEALENAVRRGLVLADKTVRGLDSLPAEVMAALDPGTAEATTVRVGDAVFAVVPAPKASTAYIFGAGHVAQPTAHLAAMVGFQVVVCDDRPEFADPGRFPEAREVRVLEDFNRAFQQGGPARKAFIVIVTRGHVHDKTVLAQALRTDAAYIGMIGSRKKTAAIYSALLREGFTREDLDRVHSPIGLAIGAETPAEIAVSIVAEMIRERAAGNP